MPAAGRAEFWRRVVEEGRGGESARLGLGISLADAGRLKDAHPILQKLVRSRSVGAEAAYALARAHREQGDTRVALKYARIAVERAPRNREYAVLLQSLERAGRKE